MAHRRRSIVTIAEIRTRSIGVDWQYEARMMGGAFHVALTPEEYNAIFTIINTANLRALAAAGTVEANRQPAKRSMSVLRRGHIARQGDGD